MAKHRRKMAKHRRQTVAATNAPSKSGDAFTASTSVDTVSGSSRKRAAGVTVAALLAPVAAAGALIVLSQQLQPADFDEGGECAAEALLELKPEKDSLLAQASTRGGDVCPATKLEVRTAGDLVELTEWAYGIEELHYDAEEGTCSWRGAEESVACELDDDFTERSVRETLLREGELTPEGLHGQWTGILSSEAKPMLKIPLELDESRTVELAG